MMERSQIFMNVTLILFFILFIIIVDKMKNEEIEKIGSLYRKSFVSKEWKLFDVLSIENEKKFIVYVKNNRFTVAFILTTFIGIIIQTFLVSKIN